MAFLKGLFKRKPGGTFLGNLVRKGASSFTGGALGSGAMMISQEEYDLKNLGDADYEQKYAKTKTGQTVNTTPNPNIKTAEQQAAEAERSQFASIIPAAFSNVVKKFWYLFVIGLGLITWGIVALFRGKKSSYKKRR